MIESLPMEGARDTDGFGERRPPRFPKSNAEVNFFD
jgi:hypothetical protein